MTRSITRFNDWLQSRDLPDNLKSEMSYYLNEVEREYTMTLGEAVFDWLDRHEADPKAGWLTPADRRFIRQGLVATGVAQRLDRYEEWQVTLPKSQRLWFTLDKVQYEYDPA